MILPIKTEFLRAIASGEKRIEYRDMTDYYISRFCECDDEGEFAAWKNIPFITFRAGYRKDAETITVQVDHIELVELIDEAGEGTDEFLFAIHLGNIAQT